MREMLKVIGEHIKTQRQLQGLTQTELARQVVVSQGYLAKIEEGQANPTLEKILKLCSILNIDSLKIQKLKL